MFYTFLCLMRVIRDLEGYLHIYLAKKYGQKFVQQLKTMIYEELLVRETNS